MATDKKKELETMHKMIDEFQETAEVLKQHGEKLDPELCMSFARLMRLSLLQITK